MLTLPQITSLPVSRASIGYSPGGVRIYDAAPWQGGNIGDVVAPTVINPYSVLNIPAYWRAMNFLSTNLASFPRSVHKDGARRTADEPAHPLERLLRRQPNACQNATIFWRTLFFHAAHTANGYAEIVRGSESRPSALRNLLPEDVSPFRYEPSEKEREYLRQRGIDAGNGAQQFYLLRAAKRVLLAADVIHLQALGYDGMSGTDIVALHTETFQRASTLNRYQTKYLQKGTVIRGAVEIPQGVSEPQVEQIVHTIRSFFSGPDAERDVIVLSDGATLKNSTISPQESQLIEQGAHVTKQIAQITGVPPQFLYEFGESKYNNSIEQMGQDVVRYTFRPWIEQAEDELTTKLLSNDDQDRGYSVNINPDALLRGDTAAVNASATTTVNAGLRTRNEGRELLGLSPDPDPESNKLKTLGDTSPGGPTSPRGETAAEMSQRLNTWHVDAAVGVIEKLKTGTVGARVATELLVAVGLPRDRAEAMVADTKADGMPQLGDAHPKPEPDAAFTALAPILEAACDRVDRKTQKAFENAAGKTGQERVIWGNVFAEDQARYVVESLTPVDDSLAQLGDRGRLNVGRIAERYAAGIRKRTATGEVQNLRELLAAT